MYQTEPGTRILVEENSPREGARGEVLLLHGLEGSSAGGYMVSLAQTLLEAGFRTYRLNMRGCGGTQHLTDSLYHSGLTHDARWLLEHLRAQRLGPRFVVGFSLGGNVTLKLAGELGEAAAGVLDGAVAVSTPIDLHACVRKMMTLENRIYEWRFVTRLRNTYRQRHRLNPARFPVEGLKGAWTVFQFDDQITAPFFGFGTAPNYYATQSSLGFLGAIRIPTLIVQAKNDPLIPFGIFEDAKIRSNPHIQLIATDFGGHLGYISRGRPRFWLDPVVARWVTEAGNKSPCRTVIER